MNAEFALHPEPMAIAVQILSDASEGYDHTNMEATEELITRCGGAESFLTMIGGMDAAARRIGAGLMRRAKRTVKFDDPSVAADSGEEPAQRYMPLSSRPGTMWLDLAVPRPHEDYVKLAGEPERVAKGCIRRRNHLDRLDRWHNHRGLKGGQFTLPF
jgi:hypothetical protein